MSQCRTYAAGDHQQTQSYGFLKFLSGNPFDSLRERRKTKYLQESGRSTKLARSTSKTWRLVIWLRQMTAFGQSGLDAALLRTDSLLLDSLSEIHVLFVGRFTGLSRAR